MFSNVVNDSRAEKQRGPCGQRLSVPDSSVDSLKLLTAAIQLIMSLSDWIEASLKKYIYSSKCQILENPQIISKCWEMLCKCISDLINRLMKWLSQSWLKSIIIISVSGFTLWSLSSSHTRLTRLNFLHPQRLSSEENSFCVESDTAHSLPPLSSASVRLFITGLHLTHLLLLGRIPTFH